MFFRVGLGITLARADDVTTKLLNILNPRKIGAYRFAASHPSGDAFPYQGNPVQNPLFHDTAIFRSLLARKSELCKANSPQLDWGKPKRITARTFWHHESRSKSRLTLVLILAAADEILIEKR
jgi:hypothetical protein